jgi:hypothetical protein
VLQSITGGNDDDEEVQHKKITPLHLAFREGNNRSINIILRYMSKIKYNASETIRDILPELVEHNEFGIYMQNLPFKTI